MIERAIELDLFPWRQGEYEALPLSQRDVWLRQQILRQEAHRNRMRLPRKTVEEIDHQFAYLIRRHGRLDAQLVLEAEHLLEQGARLESQTSSEFICHVVCSTHDAPFDVYKQFINLLMDYDIHLYWLNVFERFDVWFAVLECCKGNIKVERTRFLLHATDEQARTHGGEVKRAWKKKSQVWKPHREIHVVLILYTQDKLKQRFYECALLLRKVIPRELVTYVVLLSLFEECKSTLDYNSLKRLIGPQGIERFFDPQTKFSTSTL